MSYSLKWSLCPDSSTVHEKDKSASSGATQCYNAIYKNSLCPDQNYQSDPVGGVPGVSITAHAHAERRPPLSSTDPCILSLHQGKGASARSYWRLVNVRSIHALPTLTYTAKRTETPKEHLFNKRRMEVGGGC